MLLACLLLLTAAVALWREPQPRADNATVAATPLKPAPLPTAPVTPADAAAEAIAESAAAPAPPPDLATLPYRAAAGQRAEDLRRAASETDLPGFAAELEARAKAGDADAAWALADLAEACAEAAAIADMGDELTRSLQDMTVMGYSDAEVAAIRDSMHIRIRRCSAFPQRGMAVWRGVIADARARAQALGHPAALLTQRWPGGAADAPAVVQARQRARDAGIALLQAGEAMDLFRYAGQLARLGPYGAPSYLLAACAMLDGCMQDPRAYQLALNRDHFMATQRSSFFDLNDLSPRNRLIAEVQSAEIVRLWRARQYDQLLRGDGG